MGNKHHRLKTLPDSFRAIWERRKTFDLRVNDRDYEEGDALDLREYDPIRKVYTGRAILAAIGHVTTSGDSQGPRHIAEGYAILSIRAPVNRTDHSCDEVNPHAQSR